MECEICKAKATVHISRMENGVKQEMHLCENCAKEKFGFIFKGKIPTNSMMKGIIELFNDDVEASKALKEKICPKCGISFHEFKETGRMGCPVCYECFNEMVLPIIKRMHRNDVHIGKIPKTYEKEHSIEIKLEKYKAKMDEAVRNENFERAAELRDEIKDLENNSCE